MPNAREQMTDAYLAAHIEALNLLDHLRQIVQDMPAPDSEECPISWGHVGSLNHLCAQLTELKKHFATEGEP